MRPVIIAVGNPFRRDDGVSWLIADELETGLDADIGRSDGEPTRLLELWSGRSLAVVIDAARGDGPPGQLRHLELGDLRPEAPSTTHGGGVAEALRLGAALDRLPGRCVLLGITGTDFGHGPGCTPAVTATVPRIAEVVRGIVDGEAPP